MSAIVLFLLALSSVLFEIPLEKQPHPLPPTARETRLVRTAAELREALEGSPQDVTILLADGVFNLTEPIVINDARNVVIRSASGDPKMTVIRGRGFLVGKPGDDLIRVGSVSNLTLAYLTFADCRSYGVKVEAERFPEDVHIYGCEFRDIGIRMIKGSSSPEGRAARGSIRFCRFENTQIPPADWLYEGDYISAIDMMSLEGWAIADNVFKGIRGRQRGARGAIFIWVRSRNVTVERNLILDCDRGVSFGNPSGSTNYVAGEEHIRDSVIRNNVILPGPDAGIELWWAKDIQVHHNTIWRTDPSGRGIRGGSDQWPIERIEVVNNLVRGTDELVGEVTFGTNLWGNLPGWMLKLEPSRVVLEGPAEDIVDRGIPLGNVSDDYAGRPRGKSPDLGALELSH